MDSFGHLPVVSAEKNSDSNLKMSQKEFKMLKMPKIAKNDEMIEIDGFSSN